MPHFSIRAAVGFAMILLDWTRWLSKWVLALGIVLFPLLELVASYSSGKYRLLP